MLNINDHQRFLAFDFGEKRIGVATGQSVTRGTQALKVIACKNDQPNWQEVDNLIQEWNIEAFVVGLPLNMDDSQQEMTLKAKKFGNRLHGRFGLPIFFHDERLSSAEVKELLYELGGFKKVNQEIDAYAAEIILKGFFESNF